MKDQSKGIPMSLEECTWMGTAPRELYKFAELVEKWGKGIFAALLCIGVIFAVTEAASQAQIVDSELAVVVSACTTMIIWGLIAAAEAVFYHLIAVLIRAFASITHNTAISAKVALYQASKQERVKVAVPESKPMEQQDNTEKQQAASPKSGRIVKNQDGGWTCPSCGQKNLGIRNSCWRCDYQE